MIPEDREALHMLSGEYVLGVLDREAARELEEALADNAELRRAVAFWEERLHGLAALAPPAEPPPGTWDGIARRIAPPPPRVTAPRPVVPQLWDRLSFWRWTTAVAAAAAACLAIYIGVAPPSAAPRFVAILHAPQQAEAAWVATAGGNGLLVHAVAVRTAPGDRAFELWAIAPGASRPRSLGVIPPDGRLELGTLPAALRDGGTLAISIEPKGGSPTGQPTGPVVFSGTLVAAR